MPSPAADTVDEGPVPVGGAVQGLVHGRRTAPDQSPSTVLLLPSIHTLLGRQLVRPRPARAGVMDIGVITHATDEEPLRQQEEPQEKQAPALSQRKSNRQRITKQQQRRRRRRRRRQQQQQQEHPIGERTRSSSSCSSSGTSNCSDETNEQGSKETIPALLSSGLTRPRWRPQERLKLLSAVVEDKQLDDMATFQWGSVALKVGRSRKACKDQWRREMLRSIIDHFAMLANNSSDI